MPVNNKDLNDLIIKATNAGKSEKLRSSRFKRLIRMIKSDLREYVETIPEGTFNYREYARCERKAINTTFTVIDYTAQLPYLRAVTGPAMLVVFVPTFVGWVAYRYLTE